VLGEDCGGVAILRAAGVVTGWSEKCEGAVWAAETRGRVGRRWDTIQGVRQCCG
jgi:hypothetical protein